MSDSWQSVILIILSGLVGALLTYVINNRLNRDQKIMEVKREIYSEVHEKLSGFFDNATSEAREDATKSVLKLYRQTQLWVPKSVVCQFNKFWDVFDKINQKPQHEINKEYKKLVVVMHKDLTRKNISEEEIRTYGRIT